VGSALSTAIGDFNAVELFRWLWRYFILGGLFVFPAYFVFRFVHRSFRPATEATTKAGFTDAEPLPTVIETRALTGGFSMAARLGHVLGWAGDIVGCLLMLTGAYWGLVGTTDRMAQFLFFFVPGLVIFLIGRACRYVLAGSS
jgi:hypothetical protein